MEKMKRLISGFLALVLVLGMVPGVSLSAGAEELETAAAETVAVETTQPEVIPEETAAPETAAPVVTEPAQTVPQETVPAETEAEETVPQDTVPVETVPEETVTEETVAAETVPVETVPEETIEELEASAEAADAVEELIPVDEVKVVAAKERTYLGDRVKLTVAVSPENATVQAVEWNVEGELVEDGILISSDTPGAVEVYADVSYLTEEGEVKQVRSESVYVTFLEYWMEINLLPLAEENLFEEDDPQYDSKKTCLVKGGESLKLSAKYMTRLLEEDQAGQEKDYIVESLSEPDIEWSLNEGAEQYVSMTVGKTDKTEVTLKAKTVTKTYVVTLTATDKIAGEHSMDVVIYPEPYKVTVTADSMPEGMVMDGNTITVDLGKFTAFEEQVALTAKINPKEDDPNYPQKAVQNLIWECSDKIITLTDPDEEDDKNKVMLLTVDNYEGTSTITITSEEDSDISTTITVKRLRLMDKENLSISLASSQITEVIAGKSETFTAIDIRDREILTTDVVEWSLPYEDDHPYASITKAGKLTVKDISVGKVITLRCSIIGHSADDEQWMDWTVTVRPKATLVEILPGDLASEQNPEDVTCNGQTLYVNTVNDVDPFKLGVRVYALDTEEEVGAKQEVTWKSSSTSIAAIDPDTDEIIWKGKKGTVTITATAADGSGKKATVKLNFRDQAESIAVILPGVNYVRSGSSLPLDVTLTPAKIDEATGKSDVTWKLLECDRCEDGVACAKISSAGKITAKTVYENHTITVCATTKDGSNLTSESVEITIKPKKDGILVLKDGDSYLTKTTQMLDVASEESITLEPYTLGYEDELEYVTWKPLSSKTVQLEVNSDGSVTATMLKTGTATVTATASDGRKATVTLKGVRKTAEVIVEQKNNQEYLASGKSMTLKATPVDADGKTATVKKVSWKLEGEGAAYATITSAGKLTAAKNYVGDPVEVTVLATATDGSGVAAAYPVMICPIAQGVRIDLDGFEKTRTSCLYGLGSSPASLSLTAVVYPENAGQDVTWKSSSKSIAEVDPESGELTVKKAGTVTITATANDGSGKKASFKLKIVKLVDDITFNNHHVLAEGKKMTLKPTLWDADGKKITNRKLKWSIDDDTYASITQKGVLTAKTVSETKTVTVTAETIEESADWVYSTSWVVNIYPKTTSVTITYNGSNKVTEVHVPKGETRDLDAVSYSSLTATKAAQEWTWKTSNKKVATVDENGVVTGLKAGTVTITATAKDGTGKKDTIKIKVLP